MTDEGQTLVARQARLPGRIEVGDFSLRGGQCVVLCGPNGSGKSSLLRLLAGLERKMEGHVTVSGLDVRIESRKRIATQLAWLPQRPYLGQGLTCEAIVAAARFRFQEATSRALGEARRILEKQGIAHLAARSAQQVSGGELQRVLFAAMMAQDVPFLLVDEPANHLDPHHQIAAYQTLGRLWKEQRRAIVVVTHDIRLAKLLGPAEEVRVIGIQDGGLAWETPLNASDLPERLSALYGVEFVSPELPGGLAVQLPHGAPQS